MILVNSHIDLQRDAAGFPQLQVCGGDRGRLWSQAEGLVNNGRMTISPQLPTERLFHDLDDGPPFR